MTSHRAATAARRALFTRCRRRAGPRIVLAGALLAACDQPASDAQQAAARQPRASAPPAAAVRGAVDSYAGVVREVSPAVVTVRVERRARAPRRNPFLDDPMLREFFGIPPQAPQGAPPEFRISGMGSGVIVDPAGVVLTNHHVVDGAESIRVELDDGRVADAELAGSDPPSDLAVLRIDGGDLPSIPLGDSDAAQVGDVVLAIGSPLGLEKTVTQGIISAKGRTTGLGEGSFEDFLQTDASINRGNSGGALINTRGELVGINSQILSPTGGSIGIGFAIPSNMARDVMGQLLETGRVRRGRLGVAIQDVTAEIAASLGLERVAGAIVSSVDPDSPADAAGVEVGDVIVGFEGRPVGSGNQLRNAVAGTRPGTAVTLTVLRDGAERELSVDLGELEIGGEPGPGDGGDGDGAAGLGLGVEELDADTARQLGLPPDTRGVLVRTVEPGGAAAAAGLRPGDVIQRVGDRPVGRPEELRQAVREAGDRPVLLLVNRGGQTAFAAVRPGD